MSWTALGLHNLLDVDTGPRVNHCHPGLRGWSTSLCSFWIVGSREPALPEDLVGEEEEHGVPALLFRGGGVVDLHLEVLGHGEGSFEA